MISTEEYIKKCPILLMISKVIWRRKMNNNKTLEILNRLKVYSKKCIVELE